MCVSRVPSPHSPCSHKHTLSLPLLSFPFSLTTAGNPVACLLVDLSHQYYPCSVVSLKKSPFFLFFSVPLVVVVFFSAHLCSFLSERAASLSLSLFLIHLTPFLVLFCKQSYQ